VGIKHKVGRTSKKKDARKKVVGEKEGNDLLKTKGRKQPWGP